MIPTPVAAVAAAAIEEPTLVKPAPAFNKSLYYKQSYNDVRIFLLFQVLFLEIHVYQIFILV